MSDWILRFSKPREGIRDLRELMLLERRAAGTEAEVESFEIEAGTPAFGDVVAEQIAGQGRSLLIFDMIHEKNLDSSDLAQIMGAVTRAREAGGELVLVNANSRVQEILRITRLDEVFTLYDSIDAAIEGTSE